MNPWTIDADDIHLATDFDEELLYHTQDVDEFLQADGNRFVVLGTKGIGKTLLLKAKRISCQERFLCLPRNALIDKPIGDKVFSSGMISLYGDSTENWKKVWLLSISLTALKSLDRTDDLNSHDRSSPPHAPCARCPYSNLTQHFANAGCFHIYGHSGF